MYFRGMLEIRLTSADIARAMTVINGKGITLWNVKMEDSLSCTCMVRQKDRAQLTALCRRLGCEMNLLGQRGLYFSGLQMLKRPVLITGFVFLLILACWIPRRVFFFEVEGNRSLPDREIIAAMESCGVGFGSSREALRSEQIKNALLGALPELQWAGINTYGCRAVITVREREQGEATQQKPGGVGSIVATRDGVIQEMTVVRGSGACVVGQAVKAGEVLISGYTDCGLTIRATRAEGEVYAQTRRDLTVITPINWNQRGDESKSVKKYSLIFGKKRINFFKGSGISPTGCVKMYEENYLTLPGGFRLPVALVTEVWTESEDSPCSLTGTDVTDLLTDFARRYLSRQMVAGKILASAQSQTEQEDVCVLYGKYACSEMIGQLHSEEIIR